MFTHLLHRDEVLRLKYPLPQSGPHFVAWGEFKASFVAAAHSIRESTFASTPLALSSLLLPYSSTNPKVSPPLASSASPPPSRMPTTGEVARHLILFVLLSFIFGPIHLFLLPLNDVDLGPMKNVLFLFVVIPFELVLGLSLWAALTWMTVYGGHSSSSSSDDDAQVLLSPSPSPPPLLLLLPVRHTLLELVLSSMSIAVLFTTILSSFLSIPNAANPMGAFPLPFTTLTFGAFAILVFFLSLVFFLKRRSCPPASDFSATSPQQQPILYRNAVYHIGGQLIVVSVTLVLCVMSGVAWAIVFYLLQKRSSFIDSQSPRDEDMSTAARRWLYAWLMLYEPLLYVTKFYVLAPIAASVNPKKVRSSISHNEQCSWGWIAVRLACFSHVFIYSFIFSLFLPSPPPLSCISSTLQWHIICQTLNIFFLVFLLTALQDTSSNPITIFGLTFGRMLSILWRVSSAEDRFEMFFSNLWDDAVVFLSKKRIGDRKVGVLPIDAPQSPQSPSRSSLPSKAKIRALVFMTSRLTFHAMKMAHDQSKEENKQEALRRKSERKEKTLSTSTTTKMKAAAALAATADAGTLVVPRGHFDAEKLRAWRKEQLVVAQRFLVKKTKVGIAAEDPPGSADFISSFSEFGAADTEPAFLRESSVHLPLFDDASAVSDPVFSLHDGELDDSLFSSSPEVLPSLEFPEPPQHHPRHSEAIFWDGRRGRSSSLSSFGGSARSLRLILEEEYSGAGLEDEAENQDSEIALPPSPTSTSTSSSAVEGGGVRATGFGWVSSRLLAARAALSSSSRKLPGLSAASAVTASEEEEDEEREPSDEEVPRLGLLAAVKVSNSRRELRGSRKHVRFFHHTPNQPMISFRFVSFRFVAKPKHSPLSSPHTGRSSRSCELLLHRQRFIRGSRAASVLSTS